MLNRFIYLIYRLTNPLRRYLPGWNRRTATGVIIWWVILAGIYQLSRVSLGSLTQPTVLAASVGAGDVHTTSQTAAATPAILAQDSSINVSPSSHPAAACPNSYAWGNCTYYVASQRPVPPLWGNAKNWYAAAARAGWSEGSQPQLGAIAWTPAGWLGHVALVINVAGDQVEVSEMNYAGFNRVDQRWAPISSFKYIY